MSGRCLEVFWKVSGRNQFGTGQVGQVKLELVKSGQVKSRQADLGQVKPGLVKSEQVKSCTG